MKVLVFNQQRDLSLSILSIKSVIKEVLAVERIETNEIAAYFVSKKEICRLHAEFFHDPSSTDCITFPMDGRESKVDYHILGEVFICPQTACEYILMQKKGDHHNTQFCNWFYTETTLYLVHGLLHLLGYEDLSIEDQTLMRTAEKRHMKNLVSKDLILKNTVRSRNSL